MLRFYKTALLTSGSPSRGVEEVAFKGLFGTSKVMAGKGFDELSGSGWSVESFTKNNPEEVSPTNKARQATAKRPPTRILSSLLALVLFPFTGIVAVIMSINVASAWRNGAERLAVDYSQRARFWVVTSLYMAALTFASLFIISLVSSYSFQTL